MSMSLKVIVPPHPLINHWLSILRNKHTHEVLYSTGFEQIGKWLTYEALRDWLPFRKELIETNTGEAEGIFVDTEYPIRVIVQSSEGLSLWLGSKEIIPNSTLSLGCLPDKIANNEGIIIYSEQIMKNNRSLKILEGLNTLGVESNRILLISCISGNLGLNEIAKRFPKQTIYTACIDNEEGSNEVLDPGIGNPIFRLSTKFQ